jgi:hypothetical protein
MSSPAHTASNAQLSWILKRGLKVLEIAELEAKDV